MTISASSLPRVPKFGRPARIPVRHSTRARARPSGRALQILAAGDVARLEVFYQGLGFDDRRARFGSGVSDESISTYCRTLDWHNTIVIARGGLQCFDTVLEINFLTRDWSEAEISITCPLTCDRSHIFAELLQLAAFKAGVLGCMAFMLHRPWAGADLITVAQSIGQVSRASDYLRIDIADYADAGCRSAKRDF